ncbi:hypothetical protein B6V73_05965 [Thioclava sp. JM3]|uniref:hypothetical protein n=1 Tax=Thioclava sp. JM3 TaxID=1973004 RepID=UPI000B541017|nr:hypothetical protein [Thioclava sp. JM3]OWY17229.1 hypothetical protein B6V73_05965 [Thioclava sp. JM3]
MARATRTSQPAPLWGIGAYWRGAYPPWIALIVVLIGGRFAVARLWQVVSPPVPMPLFSMLILADIALAVWQVVGAWRSVSHWVDARARGDVLFAARVAIGAVAVVSATHALDQSARQTMALAPIAHAGPMPLEVRNGIVYLTGDISYDLLARFEATPTQGVSAIDLDSAGGHVFAARALAQRVMRRGLKTRVTKRCYSACTLIFMAGAHRDLGPEGKLGFHGYSLEAYPLPIDIGKEEEIDRAFLRERGVTARFAARVFATPHTDIWRPDRHALTAAGVLRD